MTHYERAPSRLRREFERGAWLPTSGRAALGRSGALPQAPGFSKAWLRCPMGPEKEQPPATRVARGPMHHRRTVGLAIPCHVASPQSLTPFYQAIMSVARVTKKKRSTRGKVGLNSKPKPRKERPMDVTKYIGMDVHTATTVIAVLNAMGKVLAEAIIETKASAILDFIKSQRGTLWVTFEEGTQAAWLYDLIQPHVAKLVVCDPRKITTEGNKA